MEVILLQGRTPPLPPADVHVVIDVLRAFTVSHVALSGGARRIDLVATVDEALARKRAEADVLLVGESEGRRVAGFDYENSPVQLGGADVRGRTLVMRTSNGVQAVLHAVGAPRGTYVAGLRDARTLGLLLRRRAAAAGLQRAIIVASHPDGDDDLACAEYLRAQIAGQPQPDFAATRARVMASHAAQKFRDPEQAEFRSGDLDVACEESPLPFVQRVSASPPPVAIVAEEITL